MRLDKQMLIAQLLDAGEIDKAERADRELPDAFDPLEVADVLLGLGVDPALLLSRPE